VLLSGYNEIPRLGVRMSSGSEIPAKAPELSREAELNF